jgi:hypothetical protein
MIPISAVLAVVLLLSVRVPSATGQDCGAGLATAEQQEGQRNAIRVARMINSAQANQPGRVSGQYLSHADLQASFLRQPAFGLDPFTKSLNFSQGAQLFSGWSLKLDVTLAGYWFMIRSENNPCGFSVISNEQGVILTAEPIRLPQ